jgi:hypothetical protein
MSSTIPTVRQGAWFSIIPQLTFMGLLILIWDDLNTDNPVFYGALTYLIISFSLRTFIPRDHKTGITNVKQEKFQEAIPYFEKSYGFFRKFNWLDKYRYLTLLSSSKMSYKEMALNNIAFCYGQVGDGIKSKEYYERTLLEFPDSGMAKSALRLLSSMEGKKDL